MVAAGSLTEDVLDLLERARGENVSEAQIRRPRVLARVHGVGRYEDRRPRPNWPRLAADADRAGPFEDEVDLGLPVPVFVQCLAGGIFAMPKVSASLRVTSPLTSVLQ